MGYSESNQANELDEEMSKELQAEIEEQARLLGMSGSREAKLLARINFLEMEVDRLTSAIRQTLAENAHLADGDSCTLLVLKHAIESSSDA